MRHFSWLAVCGLVIFALIGCGDSDKPMTKEEIERLKADLADQAEIARLKQELKDMEEQKNRREQEELKTKKAGIQKRAEWFVENVWPKGTPNKARIIQWFSRLSDTDQIEANKAGQFVGQFGVKDVLESDTFTESKAFIRKNREYFPAK